MNPGFVSVGDLKSLRTAIDRRRAAKVADAQEHVRHLSKKCGETQINVIVNWLPHDDNPTSEALSEFHPRVASSLLTICSEGVCAYRSNTNN